MSPTGYPSKPSPQPSYPGQNVYPTGYPQQTSNVPDYGAQQQNVYPGFVSSGYPVPPPPNGPYPGYPQPSSPSDFSGYYEVYPGQNQIYSEQPEYPLYPAPVGGQYPYNGNVYGGYPEQQFAYPAIESGKPKKPQATTAAPSAIVSSTQPSSGYYGSKSTESPNSNPGLIDIRINFPDKTEVNDGQKAVVLGKNELLSPSSGSSGYSSSLTPQYVNSPAKTPAKTPPQYPSEQESNIIILSSSKPESSGSGSTPWYSASSTVVTQQPERSNSVEPSSTVPSYEEQFSTLSPDSSTPVNIIPYPLPIVPNPGSCPCYFVPPTGNSTSQQQPQQQQQTTFDLNNLPEGAVIGFVPVVFYPSCGGASKEVLSSKLEPVFPSAYQVPYKCSYCEQSESQTATIRNSFDQVVKQSQLHPSVVVKSPSRKTYPNAPIYDQQEFGKKINVVRRKTNHGQN